MLRKGCSGEYLRRDTKLRDSRTPGGRHVIRMRISLRRDGFGIR